MATQIFVPQITLAKEDVGNSIFWSYTYDGEFIRFFYGVEEKPRIEKKFPVNTICVFVANGRDSKVSELKPPKNIISRTFWKYGLYRGNYSDTSFSAYGYYNWYIDIYTDCKKDEILSDNKWHVYNNGHGKFIFKDMVVNGKRIASAFIAYPADRSAGMKKWFWFNKSEFNEELCKEFFKGCPLDILWTI